MTRAIISHDIYEIQPRGRPNNIHALQLDQPVWSVLCDVCSPSKAPFPPCILLFLHEVKVLRFTLKTFGQPAVKWSCIFNLIISSEKCVKGKTNYKQSFPSFWSLISAKWAPLQLSELLQHHLFSRGETDQVIKRPLNKSLEIFSINPWTTSGTRRVPLTPCQAAD